jgi:hypothetical protein
MSATTFIYGLVHPETDQIFYVGKSDTPKRRLQLHLTESKSRRYHRHCVIDDMLKAGQKPSMTILEEVPVDEWETYEKKHIAACKAAGLILVNRTNGGGVYPNWRGKHHSEATRNKIAAANKGKPGKPLSAAHRATLSRIAKTTPRWNTGRPSPNRRPVYQYALDGTFLGKFDCASVASATERISAGMITRCCNGNVTRAGTAMYRWTFSPEGLPAWRDPLLKPVEAIDAQGNVLFWFPSRKAAAATLQLSASNISACLNPSNKQKTAGGYRWRYAE